MNAISSKNRGGQGQPAKKHWRVTSTALAVALVAGGWSFSAQALVLGQIRVQSALGEPLRAEVPVTQLTADEAASLQVGLANPGDFSGRGLIYNTSVSSVRVTFEQTGGKTAVIRLAGSRPVQDPFMDLLLDVSWRTGSMQRSYTMLIDPPASVMPAPAPVHSATGTPSTAQAGSTNTTNAPSPVLGPNATRGSDGVIRERIVAPGSTAPAPQTAAPAPAAQPRATQQASTSSRQSQTQAAQPAPRAAFGDEWTVKVARGQTLGQIASAMKPADVTKEQMLAALFRANPKAFINGNINWVKAGAVLRVPSESEIAAISQAEARRLVSQHARDFNSYRQSAASGATSVATRPPSGQRDSGEVTPPTQPATSGTQPTDALHITNNGQQAQADQRAAQDQQVANAGQRRDEIQSNQSGLQDIQTQLDGSREPSQPSAPAAPVAPVTPPPAEVHQPPVVGSGMPSTVDSPPVVDQMPPDSGDTLPADIGSDLAPSTTIDDPSPIDNPPPLVEPLPDPGSDIQSTPPVEVAPLQDPIQDTDSAYEPSLIDKLMADPLIPAGGLALVALIAFAGVKIARRRKNRDDDEYEDEDTGTNSQIDSFFADNISQQDAGASMLNQSSSLYAASQLDINADVDPVQEADVYLAYGRDEQAAEILRDALQTNPNRIALHVKLCEVYVRQNKIAQFDEQAAQLRALTSGQGNDWTRIAKLGHNLSPNNPLYADEVDTQNMNRGGFAPHFAPTPSQEPQAPSQQSPGLDMPLNMDMPAMMPTVAPEQSDKGYDLGGLSLDLPDDGMASTQAPVSTSFSEEDEGPATRLALAEEFLAIGNNDDAKEIVQEVLAENPSAEVQARVKALLDQAN